MKQRFAPGTSFDLDRFSTPAAGPLAFAPFRTRDLCMKARPRSRLLIPPVAVAGAASFSSAGGSAMPPRLDVSESAAHNVGRTGSSDALLIPDQPVRARRAPLPAWGTAKREGKMGRGASDVGDYYAALLTSTHTSESTRTPTCTMSERSRRAGSPAAPLGASASSLFRRPLREWP